MKQTFTKSILLLEEKSGITELTQGHVRTTVRNGLIGLDNLLSLMASVESIAMDGQSIGSKVAAAVTHNSDSQ